MKNILKNITKNHFQAEVTLEKLKTITAGLPKPKLKGIT